MRETPVKVYDNNSKSNLYKEKIDVVDETANIIFDGYDVLEQNNKSKINLPQVKVTLNAN